MATPNIRLSTLFRNPFVRAAFERAERDNGAAFTVPARAPRRPLVGSAARPLEVA